MFLWWVFLRFSELDNPSFWIDEGYSSIVSYFVSLWYNTVPIHFSQAFFTFFQSISFSVLGYGDWSARIPSFVFGIFSMILAYVFSRDLLDGHRYRNYGALFIAFLFTFSDWQVLWSREARFYELLSFIYLLNVYFLWKYIRAFEPRYFLLFWVSCLIWMFFHPFCFALLIIWACIFLSKSVKEYMQSNSVKKTIQDNQWILWILIAVIWIYFSVDMFVSEFVTWNWGLWNHLSVSLDLWTDIRNGYVRFYLGNLFGELWIVFVAYVIGVLYFAYRSEFFKVLLFGGIFLLNFYVISQKWYLAHSRYMFHLYSIITVFGWYTLFVTGSALFDRFSTLRKPWNIVLTSILIFVAGFSLANAYHFVFLPQKTYYIDYTSPKPDFKSAYKYLSGIKDVKIISGFPHLCFWYNLPNTSRCSYGLRVDLAWQRNTKQVHEDSTDGYVSVPYLDNLEDIRPNEYYFVLDALTIKNAPNKDIMTHIIDSCDLIYKNEWNAQPENFVGVWKCR